MEEENHLEMVQEASPEIQLQNCSNPFRVLKETTFDPRPAYLCMEIMY